MINVINACTTFWGAMKNNNDLDHSNKKIWLTSGFFGAASRPNFSKFFLRIYERNKI
jgi:hypothetical protein